jgi:hypothetical protein
VIDLGTAQDPTVFEPPPNYSCPFGGNTLCVEETLANGKGQLVISTGSPRFHVFYWEPGLSSPIAVGRPDDGVRAVAISSNGIVTGTDDGGVSVPYVWSRAGGFKRLSGTDRWYPLDVNSSGAVVGTELLGSYRAVIWDSAGHPTYLDDIPTDGRGPWVTFEQARTIADDGTIGEVGKLATSTGDIEEHAFVLTPLAGALDRSDWTGSATENAPSDPPSNAIDGNIDTRFSTGVPQHGSQGFIVSWPGDRTVGRIRIDAGPSTNDYPRVCGIWATDSTSTVTFVSCVADASGLVDVSFAPIPVQKIESGNGEARLPGGRSRSSTPTGSEATSGG